VPSAHAQITLRERWTIQSSAKISGSGEIIFQLGYSAAEWYKTSAPETVFAALVENSVSKDPYFGTNLRSVPGIEYKIGSQSASHEMPEQSPYAVPWWFRTDVEIPAAKRSGARSAVSITALTLDQRQGACRVR